MKDASEYITVEERLVAEAVSALVPSLTMTYGETSTVEVRREFVEELVAAIEDSEPFCDHAVGICACAPRAVLDDLRHVLGGFSRCRTCGGDGYLPVVGDSVTEGSVEGPGGLVLEPAPLGCPMCKGTGWVKT